MGYSRLGLRMGLLVTRLLLRAGLWYGVCFLHLGFVLVDGSRLLLFVYQGVGLVVYTGRSGPVLFSCLADIIMGWGLGEASGWVGLWACLFVCLFTCICLFVCLPAYVYSFVYLYYVYSLFIYGWDHCFVYVSLHRFGIFVLIWYVCFALVCLLCSVYNILDRGTRVYICILFIRM